MLYFLSNFPQGGYICVLSESFSSSSDSPSCFWTARFAKRGTPVAWVKFLSSECGFNLKQPSAVQKVLFFRHGLASALSVLLLLLHSLLLKDQRHLASVVVVGIVTVFSQTSSRACCCVPFRLKILEEQLLNNSVQTFSELHWPLVLVITRAQNLLLIFWTLNGVPLGHLLNRDDCRRKVFFPWLSLFSQQRTRASAASVSRSPAGSFTQTSTPRCCSPQDPSWWSHLW